ncbi:N-formylglutamate amidohydrolase [Trinickia dinghuensis]|uniref:N-formylglutamate amidohydrolase n=1 Tax=Trinickia dinghuensis TaxID=2291023 RepID=A0A3D8JTL3_9BURK|nr:N-formylglutamate amidohydrolase [Trinickia dinghuensis]RDU96220.1 N-formylglutamate amidohydrolase [Trinickia dinghuensis]
MQTPGCDSIVRADSPILVVTPHTGTDVPSELRRHTAWAPVQGRIVDPAGMLLQTAARRAGASLITARFNPCVIDFNVAADRRSLAPSFGHLRLCRTYNAGNEALYEPGAELDLEEVERRVEQYWRPFHDVVVAELERLRGLHENVLLLVSHASWWLSPYRLQPGALDCNIGTNLGKACDPRLVKALTDTVRAHGRSWVVNGQIAGAFAAQHYGTPRAGVHALEMEIAGRLRGDCAAQCAIATASSAESPPPGSSDTLMTDLLHAIEDELRGLPRALASFSKAALNSQNPNVFGANPEQRT